MICGIVLLVFFVIVLSVLIMLYRCVLLIGGL